MRVFETLVTLATIGAAFYADTDVEELTDRTFKSKVVGSNEFWLVEFYAPWCGHCKSLAPEWTKLATALKGVVNVGAVDLTTYEAVGKPYNIQGFPTIKLFGADKLKPLDYEGARIAKDIASFALKEVKAAVSRRLGLKAGGDKQGGKKKEKKAVELTDSTFQNEVLSGDDVWMVAFYAPWCGHCKALHPIWEEAATKLDGKAKFGAVDATKFDSLASKYGVRGYPTIKVFQKGQDPIDYNGERTVQAFASYIAGLSGSGAGGAQTEEEEAPQPDADSDVVTLTQANFEELVLATDDVWLVEFFAPWCGHCKNLAPEWANAATALKGKVKLGVVDATVHQGLASKYQVSGYPTIKAFAPGAKDEPTVYDGARSASAIQSYALDLFDTFKVPVQIIQVTSESVLKAACGEGSTVLCLVVAFPHILDSQVAGRESYLEALKQVAVKFRKHGLAAVWTEAGAQPDLESVLDLGGSGYPAAALVSLKKQRFVGFTGHFAAEDLADFVKRALSGKEKTLPYPRAPTVVNVEAWDPSAPLPEVPVDKDEL